MGRKSRKRQTNLPANVTSWLIDSCALRSGRGQQLRMSQSRSRGSTLPTEAPAIIARRDYAQQEQP